MKMMQNPPSNKILFKSAVIFVNDINSSKMFYISVLDQEIEDDFGASVNFVSGLSLWDISRASKMVFGNQRNNVPREFPIMELYFESEDVYAVEANCKKADIEIIHETKEQPWGQLAFRCKDPDGHLIEVGEPISAFVLRFHRQGMSEEEIHSKTSVSLEKIKKYVEKEKGKKRKEC